MRIGTSNFKQRFNCDKAKENYLKESSVSVAIAETIKKVDANLLRSKIIIIKDNDKEK
jgi:hypothetical protein